MKQIQSLKKETTTAPRFKTALNGDQFPTWSEKITKPSVTVPDMALTVEEAVQRFVRGVPVNGTKIEIYDEEDNLSEVDLQFADKITLAELKEYYVDQLEVLEQRQAARVKAAKERAKKEQEKKIDELQKRINEFEAEKEKARQTGA